MWGATWSMDAGDGLDEKCIFGTDLGEILIFTGTDPSNAANWRQEGRYDLSPPLGMNGHIQIGGDMLVVTVDGIIPLSQAIAKSPGQLDLAMLTRSIEVRWHEEVAAKRSWAWSIKKWDENSTIFVTTPGDPPGLRHCLLANNTTGSSGARYTKRDATWFIRSRADMYFGTQDGFIMQAERTGKDELFDGNTQAIKPMSYLATLVGGWEMFGAPANQVVWHQARAAFRTSANEPFQPQLAATVDYVVTLPNPPWRALIPACSMSGTRAYGDRMRHGPTRTPMRSTIWLMTLCSARSGVAARLTPAPLPARSRLTAPPPRPASGRS